SPPDPKLEVEREKIKADQISQDKERQLKSEQFDKQLAHDDQARREDLAARQQSEERTMQAQRETEARAEIFKRDSEDRAAQSEVAKAQASKPDTEQLVGVLQREIAQLAKVQEQDKAEVAQQMKETLEQIKALVSAPKEIRIRRGANNR